jgi:hypothetical protein
VSTEEDGVDDAGRTTQAPLITAPSGPEVDPDGESADAVVDNGTMSSSRAEAGGSPSGADDVAGARGKPASDPAARDGKASDDGSHSSVPLPADTVGKSSAGTSGKPKAVSADPAGDGNQQGGRQTMTSGNGTWFAGRTQTAPPAQSPDEDAEDSGASAAKDDRKPSFTPASPAPSPSPSSSAPSGNQSRPYSGTSPYSGSGTGYSGPSYTPAANTSSSSGYQGSAWQASRDATMTAQSTPSASSPGLAPSAGPAAGGLAAATSAASAATSAVTGAAAGLASSVSSAWQNRGSNTTKQRQKPTVRGRKPAKRQAMLTLARLEPWSVMKFSFLASVVAFIILFVAVAVLYMVLSALGAFDSIQHFVTTVTSAKGTSGTNISHWFSASLILGYTAMLGAVNIVLITAMSTVGSVIYNLIAKTVGGVEVTLRETE